MLGWPPRVQCIHPIQTFIMIKKTAFYIPSFRIASLLAVSAMALGLAACDKMKEPTVGERLDAAVDKTQRAAENAKDDAKDALAAAQNNIERGVAKTEKAAHDAAQAARDAGNAARESLHKSQ